MYCVFFAVNKIIYEICRDVEFHFTDSTFKCDLGLIQDKNPSFLSSLVNG